MISINNSKIITAIVVVIVGAGAFFGGMKFQETKAASSNFGDRFQRGARQSGQNNRFQGGFRPVTGEILSMDDKSITVKLQDGSSKIVILPDNVTVSKTDTGSKTDLKTGVRVGVFGTNNSDGSVTAQNVQINPMFRNGQDGHNGEQNTSQ